MHNVIIKNALNIINQTYLKYIALILYKTTKYYVVLINFGKINIKFSVIISLKIRMLSIIEKGILIINLFY